MIDTTDVLIGAAVAVWAVRMLRFILDILLGSVT